MILYKYLGPERIDVLEDRRLRLTPVFSEVLNDPLECQFNLTPREGEAAAAEADGHRSESAVVQVVLASVFSNIGVVCASENRDSLLMWSHYAASHRGFVIGIDSEAECFRGPVSYVEQPYGVTQVINGDGFGAFRRVDYATERLLVRYGDDLAGAVFSKSKEWSYECEWRLLRNLSDAEERGVDKAGVAVRSLSLSPGAIREVIIGARMESCNEKRIAAIVGSPDLSHVSLLRASMHRTKYALVLDPPSQSA